MHELRSPLQPTETQLRVFTEYVRTGSQKTAAMACGISVQTVKNHLGELYSRLGVNSAMEAAHKMGWVKLPGDNSRPACGWVGYCSRPVGHMGNHGGMRALAKN